MQFAVKAIDLHAVEDVRFVQIKMQVVYQINKFAH